MYAYLWRRQCWTSERRWASPCPVYIVGISNWLATASSLLKLSHRLLSRGQVPKSGTHPESRIARRVSSYRCGRHGASCDLVFGIMGDSRGRMGQKLPEIRVDSLNRLAQGVVLLGRALLLCWSGIDGPKTHTVRTNVSTAGP